MTGVQTCALPIFLAGLVLCQILLGFGAWVVSWGLPSGLLPTSWQPSSAITARSTWAAAVVTGHVLLGMAILAAAVVLWIVGGGVRAVGAPSAAERGRGRAEGVFA